MPRLKPRVEEFDAWHWRGFVPEGKVHDLAFGALSTSVEYVMDFEEWASEHLKDRKIRYSGNDLLFVDEWGERRVKPGQWIVLIPDEYNELKMNIMTDEQVKQYYYADSI